MIAYALLSLRRGDSRPHVSEVFFVYHSELLVSEAAPRDI